MKKNYALNMKAALKTFTMHKIKSWLLYKILREIENSSLKLIKIIVNDIHQTIAKIITTIKEHYDDKQLGIETSGYYNFRDDLSLYKDGVGYQPMSYPLLKRMIDYLKLKPGDVFVDFGCGKGRVIFFAATQRIKKVIGLELRKEFADIARTNLNNLKSRNTPVEIINTDAATFNIKDGTIFFMYHPFGEKTFVKVIDNIKDRLATNPREIRIVYHSPAHRSLLDNQDWLVPEGEIEDTKIFVWHNRA